MERGVVRESNPHLARTKGRIVNSDNLRSSVLCRQIWHSTNWANHPIKRFGVAEGDSNPRQPDLKSITLILRPLRISCEQGYEALCHWAIRHKIQCNTHTTKILHIGKIFFLTIAIYLLQSKYWIHTFDKWVLFNQGIRLLVRDLLALIIFTPPFWQKLWLTLPLKT